LDPIEVGDVLLIIYKEQMYVLVLDNIFAESFPERRISYRIAKVGQAGTLPTEVNLEKLTWEVDEAQQRLLIADGQLAFLATMDRLNSGELKSIMGIWYNHSFGYMGGQMGRVHESPFHIAIVHKADLEDSGTIDVARFRFKTWEDGLGNRCDKKVSEQIPARQEPVLLDLHNAAVRAVAVAPDGSYIVTTGDDGRVVIQHLDEVVTKVVGPFQGGRLSTLAVSADGTWVLAGGDLNNASSILKVHVANGKYEQIGIDSTGTMRGLWYCKDEEHIAYITGNRLAFFDVKACELLHSHNIFGGFPWDNAGSAARKFFAAISQNMVDNMSAEPCKLTIFDEKGAETLSYRFESCRYGYRSKVTFLDSDCLALCLPSGEIWQWKWSLKDRKWSVDKKVQITRGESSAVASCLDGKAVCLAQKSTVLVIDASTGQTLYEKVFEIGQPKSRILAKPITAIREIPSRQTLVITFWDGRVALLRIPDEVIGGRPLEP
jgi:WD40 repeat protein